MALSNGPFVIRHVTHGAAPLSREASGADHQHRQSRVRASGHAAEKTVPPRSLRRAASCRWLSSAVFRAHQWYRYAEWLGGLQTLFQATSIRTNGRSGRQEASS